MRPPNQKAKEKSIDPTVRKNPHAVALGRLGGLAGGTKGGKARAASLTPDERQKSARKAGKKGGKARLAKMTPEQRSEVARKAALARWGKSK
jgi:hypothetical protein